MEAELLAIYRDCWVLTMRRAARIVGSDATGQDIAQQVFIKVLSDLQMGVAIRTPAAYCYQAATNLALNYLRDSRRRDELLAQQDWSDKQSQIPEETMALRQMIASCDEDIAVVAAYHYLDGLEQTEIASLLGVSRRSINRRLEKFNEHAKRLLTGKSGHV